MSPSTIFCPKILIALYRSLSSSSRVAVHVAMDNLLAVEEAKACARDARGQWQRTLLLFIPLRLGLSDINPVYYRDLRVSSNFFFSLSYGEKKKLLSFFFVLHSLGKPL